MDDWEVADFLRRSTVLGVLDALADAADEPGTRATLRFFHNRIAALIEDLEMEDDG